MARRALKDEMPGMVVRGVVRAIAKGVVQDQLEQHGGLLGAIIGSVASAATEQADDRMWRMLPGRVYVARGYLPPGQHTVSIHGRNVVVSVDGQYALVPLRFYESSMLTGDVGKFGTLPVLAEVSKEEKILVTTSTKLSAKADGKVVKKTTTIVTETKQTSVSNNTASPKPAAPASAPKQAASAPAKSPLKVAEKAATAALN